jgi:hypothetical protein
MIVSLERGINVSSKRATRASVENIKTKILRNPGTLFSFILNYLIYVSKLVLQE